MNLHTNRSTEMNVPQKISDVFTELRSKKQTAFIPFIPAGDPNLNATGSLISALPRAGADLIEIGFPFSDPIADGPVIQAAYTRALNQGIRVESIFEMIHHLSSKPSWKTPLVGMVSYSLVFRPGVSKFLTRANQSGLSGLIVPDLPIDEAEELSAAVREHHLDLIMLVSPLTPIDRAAKIAKYSSGFLYCVSTVGITGERTELPSSLQAQLKSIRELTSLPLCIGFGISQPSQVQRWKEFADGLIVGSAIVRRLEKANEIGMDSAQSEIVEFVQEFSRECKIR